ncbi:hypothetical protein [Nocardia amamiensis]|uniref:hypothetical protein n=1 Tax=Nocardia amamiensis TaxID=404578 RepID=UPI0033C4C4D4
MRLQVSSAVPAAESTVGMRGLVSYHWESALGDTPITRRPKIPRPATTTSVTGTRATLPLASSPSLSARA